MYIQSTKGMYGQPRGLFSPETLRNMPIQHAVIFKDLKMIILDEKKGGCTLHGRFSMMCSHSMHSATSTENIYTHNRRRQHQRQHSRGIALEQPLIGAGAGLNLVFQPRPQFL